MAVSLLDLKPQRQVVPLRGQDIEVRGVTADGIVHLLQTFPELQKAFAGVPIDMIGVQTIVGRMGHTVGEIIAMGVGQPGDAETIAFAMTELSAGEQLELLQPIFKLTFPNGVKSFVEGLTRAADSADVLGRAQRTKSPVRSNASLSTDTDSKSAGE